MQKLKTLNVIVTSNTSEKIIVQRPMLPTLQHWSYLIRNTVSLSIKKKKSANIGYNISPRHVSEQNVIYKHISKIPVAPSNIRHILILNTAVICHINKTKKMIKNPRRKSKDGNSYHEKIVSI